MRFASFFLPTYCFFRNKLICAVQVFHLFDGSKMVSRRVLMNHPRNVMSSLRPPLVFIFLIKAGLGRFIGYSRLARGQKMMNRAMPTNCAAHKTICQLFSESRTAQTLLSMYPLAPPLQLGSSLTSASSAAPDRMSSSRRFGDRMWAYGEGSFIGTHSLQARRLLARSKTDLDTMQKVEGAELNPNRRRVRITRTWFSGSGDPFRMLSKYHTAIHFVTTRALVCMQLYAFSTLILLPRICSLGGVHRRWCTVWMN